MSSADTGVVLPDSFDSTDENNYSIRLLKENEALKRQVEALKKENIDGVFLLAKIHQEEKIACQKAIDMLMREIKLLKTFYKKREANLLFKFRVLKAGVRDVLQGASRKDKHLVEKIEARLDVHQPPSSFLDKTSFSEAVNSLLETLDETAFTTALKSMIEATGESEKRIASLDDEREKFAASLRDTRHQSTLIDGTSSDDDVADNDNNDDLIQFEPIGSRSPPPENPQTLPRRPTLIRPGTSSSKAERQKDVNKKVKFTFSTIKVIDPKGNMSTPSSSGPMTRGKNKGNNNNGGTMPPTAYQFVLIRESSSSSSRGNRKPNWKYFVARLLSQAKMGNRKVFKVDYYTRQCTFDSFYSFKINPKKQGFVIDEEDIVISDLSPPFNVTSQNILQFNFNFSCKEFYNLSY